MKGLIGQGIVGAAGYMSARLFSNLIGSASWIPTSIRPHAAILGNVFAVALAYKMNKVPVLKKFQKYQPALLLGTSISLVTYLIDRYMPASLQPYLGAPAAMTGALAADAQAYEQAMAGMGAYIREPLNGYGPQGSAEHLNEYISEGGPVTEALAEYVREDLGVDEDGAVIPDYSVLDAGVDGSGLYGDPTLEMLDDDVEFLSGDGGAASAPFRTLTAANKAQEVAAQGTRLGRPAQEVVQVATAAAARAAGGAPNAALRQTIAQAVAEGIRAARSFPSLQRPSPPLAPGVVPSLTVPVQDPSMGAPMEVVAIRPDADGLQTGSIYGTGTFAGKAGGIFDDHTLH